MLKPVKLFLMGILACGLFYSVSSSKCNDAFFKDNGVCVSCPEHCSSCESAVRCWYCKPFYWNITALCERQCPSNCPTACNAETGKCYSCNTGFYGDDCAHSCESCKDNKCFDQRCTNGCKDGYFQDTFQGSTHPICRECSPQCLKCVNWYKCDQCQPGFFLDEYNSNGAVLSQCLQCSNHCSSCISKDRCTSCQYFDSNCKECKYNGTSYSCTMCESGFNLSNGQCYVEKSCSSNCLNGCETEGICIQCKVGFSGLYCNLTCNETCETCQQTNPKLCERCKNDYFTTLCNIPCNGNCLHTVGNSACKIEDGICSNGCKPGYWGEYCEKTCSINCLKSEIDQLECNRFNGTCLFGCKPDFAGLMCDLRITTTAVFSLKSTEQPITPWISDSTTQSPSENQYLRDSQETSDSSGVSIGAGVGGGVAVAAVIVIVIIIIMRKRRTENDTNHCSVFGVKTRTSSSPTVTFTNNLYINGGTQNTESREDESYLYTVPNKRKLSKKITVDISDPLTSASNGVVIELEPETDDENNTDETIKLENIDDGDVVVLKRDLQVPSSDTYYNMAGLLRSRIQVTNLLEYLRNKRDFETEFEKLPKGLTRTCNEAITLTNRGKNRYNGIYAYDATRVVLRSKDYINACYIECQDDPRAYIACLGPTKSTMNQFSTFWEMVWQENTETIVMLTNLIENEKMKCEQYWPDDGSMRLYGKFSVTTTSEQIYAEFVVRELQVVKARDVRKVMHYHYTAWPDKSYPDTVVSLLEFRNKVEKNQSTRAGPIVVHCSAGIGRTGTYIALDMLIKEGRTEHSVDIFGCVIGLRGQRTNMVQNVEQYEYLHHCVVYALVCNPEPLDIAQLSSSLAAEKAQEYFQAFGNFPPLPEKETHSVEKNTRKKENRKGADIPADLYRIKLKQTKKDYINAVYINSYMHEKNFIAAQTPMPNTVEDFVSMMYQEDVGQIVCLDDENITDKTVAQYFPPVNKALKVGQFQISCIRCESHDSLIQSELRLLQIGAPSSPEKKITHYQFRRWLTEETIPNSQTDFLHLLSIVNNPSGHKDRTTLVHCLNGAEKSGLFCAIAIMLEKLTVEKEVSVINTVWQVRSRRKSALCDIDKFKFCYKCIQEHLETAEAKTYYNIL